MNELRRSRGLAALGLLVLAVMRMASPITAGACYFALAGLCFYSEKFVLRALGLSWLVTMWSPALAPVPTLGSAGRFLVIGAAATSCFIRWGGLRGRLLISRPVASVSAVGAFVVIHSMFFSAVPAISLLKGISWSLATVTLVSAWGRLSDSGRGQMRGELQVLLLLVLVGSVPLFAAPAGYLVNGSGFQGMLGHPQAFGPTMAILGTILLADIVGSERPPIWKLGSLVVSVAFVFASEARTAAFALVGAVIGAVSLEVLRNGFSSSNLVGLKGRRLYTAVLIGGIVASAQAPQVSRGLEGFVAKRAEAHGVLQAYEESRGMLMDSMWEGFVARPLTGNGFGLPTAVRVMEVVYDSSTGLPAAAPVEKGVLPLAMLEDIGIFGFMAFAFWVISVVRRSIGGGLGPLAVILTILALNMGEANLLSPGGFGMLSLLCFAWGGSYPLNRSAVRNGTFKA